jgi:hypothetical protein
LHPQDVLTSGVYIYIAAYDCTPIALNMSLEEPVQTASKVMRASQVLPCNKGNPAALLAERLQNFQIRVGSILPEEGKISSNALCAEVPSALPGGPTTIQCSDGGQSGRYLSLQLMGTGTLHVCEVQVEFGKHWALNRGLFINSIPCFGFEVREGSRSVRKIKRTDELGKEGGEVPSCVRYLKRKAKVLNKQQASSTKLWPVTVTADIGLTHHRRAMRGPINVSVSR